LSFLTGAQFPWLWGEQQQTWPKYNQANLWNY